jgi:hypothetical protein
MTKVGYRGCVVGFLIEVFWAILMVGAPIAVFTLALVYFALLRGSFSESLDTKALQREIKAMSKKNKGKNKEALKENAVEAHPLQKKWAKFGGGFYGIVAFFTYIVVEVLEIINMVKGFGGFFDFIKQLDFGVIIHIFVEALTNFISAMIWPVYWMQRIDTDHTWIWFVVAYAGYWVGLKLAQTLIQRRLASAPQEV